MEKVSTLQQQQEEEEQKKPSQLKRPADQVKCGRVDCINASIEGKYTTRIVSVYVFHTCLMEDEEKKKSTHIWNNRSHSVFDASSRNNRVEEEESTKNAFLSRFRLVYIDITFYSLLYCSLLFCVLASHVKWTKAKKKKWEGKNKEKKYTQEQSNCSSILEIGDQIVLLLDALKVKN